MTTTTRPPRRADKAPRGPRKQASDTSSDDVHEDTQDDLDDLDVIAHPKLEARRDEVERDEHKRRLRTIGALIVITLGAIGALAALDSSLLDVDRVLVNGAVRTDPAEAIASAAIVEGDPLAELDLIGAEQRIGLLPWVASATVERSWNGDVRISIVERVPVAAIPTDGGVSLIDQAGRQLEVVAEQPPEMLPISGVTASGRPGEPAPPTARAAVNVLDRLTPDLAAQIEQVVIRPDGVLELDLVGEGRAVLGDDSSLDDKLIGLETMLVRADLRCLASIDLRVPSAPALTRARLDGSIGALDDLSTCT